MMLQNDNISKNMNNKIGILTWHYYQNVGSQLQAFALQHVLTNMGYNVNIIDYRNPKIDNSRLFKRKIKVFLSRLFGEKFSKVYYPYLEFQNKYFKLSPTCHSVVELNEVLDGYDYIVYGGDQIWAPNVYNSIYFGDGVSNRDIKKISYASSIGLRYIPSNLVLKYKHELSDFKSIGIRETTGKAILKKYLDIDSEVVLDPTLLLDVDTYRNMERRNVNEGRKFIFCYFLKENHDYRKLVEKYAKNNNLDLIGITKNKSDIEWMKTIVDSDPLLFLWYIDHAETVFTDSYHGSIFSLLYHKRFYIFKRFEFGESLDQNSRIEQLAMTFNINSMIVDANMDNIPDSKIDYSFIDDILSIERAKSVGYLTKALSN